MAHPVDGSALSDGRTHRSSAESMSHMFNEYANEPSYFAEVSQLMRDGEYGPGPGPSPDVAPGSSMDRPCRAISVLGSGLSEESVDS